MPVSSLNCRRKPRGSGVGSSSRTRSWKLATELNQRAAEAHSGKSSSQGFSGASLTSTSAARSTGTNSRV